MNFKKFQNLAKVVKLPLPLTDIDSWEESEELFQKLITKVDPKHLEEYYINLPSDMDRANFFSFRNAVFTQWRNNCNFGKSFWDE